jgi:hypothetical protein
MNFFRHVSLGLASFLLCSLPTEASAQESGSSTSSSIATATPATALRDILVAACSHDETSFRRFLTARNAQSFSQMTAAARTELMKRFVLLEDVGVPNVASNKNGQQVIRCQTNQGSAAIEIGKTELHDNVAFLPVQIGDASDPDSTHAHHILMSLVREEGKWKILSVGLLFMDLPSLAVEWDRAESAQNEKAALAALKSLAAAIEEYRRKYLRLPETLAQLGPPEKGTASTGAAGLIDAGLASGRENGYSFRYVIVGASDVGAPAKYELSATPQPYGRAGKTSFFRDSSGVYHAADHLGAVGSDLDPKIE